MAIVSSDVTKVRVLGKLNNTRIMVVPSPARTVCVQFPLGANFFGCRYKKIHLFPTKYTPYAFLLWADTRNVVATSPARTVWVQIPPSANFFRCRYKKIHIFSAKYRPYAFLLWADMRNVVAPSPARTVWVQIPPGANVFSSVGISISKYTFSGQI